MPATATKIKVTNILINRAEGPANLCIKSMHTSWASAEHFEDGETYEGRYDAKSMNSPDYGLARHIKSHMEFLTGEACPGHMNQNKYASVINMLKQNKPTICEDAKAFLANYSLED